MLQNIKKLRGEKKSEKRLSAKKTEREDPLGFFNIHSAAKHQKISNRGPFGEFFSKKVSMPKKLKGGTLKSLPVWYVTRKKGKTFLVLFARPNESIWDHKIVKNFEELLWSVRELKKKSHYNSRVSFHEAPTKNGKGDKEKIPKKSNSAEKVEKEGTFCFGMVLYFMSEALVRNQVLSTYGKRTVLKKMDHSE